MTLSLFKVIFYIVIISAVAYGLWEGSALIEGPQLSLSSPLKGAVTGNGFITVAGTVKRVNSLTINGLSVLPNENGSFKKILVFPRGEGALKVAVTDQFGRSVTRTQNIISQQ